ncbi:MAG: hypothetical protein ABI305_03120 [Tepidiformaceae bacterium]
MKLRLEKPWRDLSEDESAALPGQLGVFQLANETGEVVYVGYAGGRELFGLRSAIERHRKLGTGGATHFRYEVNMQYQSRYRELLMLHVTDNGGLPIANEHEHPVHLGRIG